MTIEEYYQQIISGNTELTKAIHRLADVLQDKKEIINEPKTKKAKKTDIPVETPVEAQPETKKFTIEDAQKALTSVVVKYNNTNVRAAELLKSITGCESLRELKAIADGTQQAKIAALVAACEKEVLNENRI